MSRSLPPLLATLLVLVTVASAAAQEVLTLDQAVREALAGNAGLRAGAAAVDLADAHLADARSSWFPRLAVAEAWQRGNEPVFVFGSLLSARQFTADDFAIDALNHPDPIGRFRTSLAIEHLAVDFGRRRASEDRATAARETSRLVWAETRASVVVSTIEAYGRIVSADAARRAAGAAIDAARSDQRRAVNRRDAGLATDADVLALDAHIAALVQARIRHESDAAIAQAALNRLTGSPIDRRFATVVPALPTIDDFPDVPSLLAEAEAARPELRRAALRGAMAHASAREARASRLPQVGVQGGLDVTGTTFGDRLRSWVAGVETRWSLSLGGAERARARAAAADIQRAAAEADDARAAVHLDVVTALRRLESASARIAAGHAAVAQARETERILRARTDAGLASLTDLLRASAAVLDAVTAEVAATVDALVGHAELRRALGRQP